MTISVPKDWREGPGLHGPLFDDEAIDTPFAPDGERVSIAERIVVAPAWGRVQKRPLSEGQWIEEGSVIGYIRENGDQVPLVCHGSSVFVTWLAHENERVPPGRALARLRTVEE
jgi:hypothetical protein